jgi:hypothetical protein
MSGDLDLIGEMAAAQCRLSGAHRDRLIGLGIPGDVLDLCGWVGVERVSVRGALYQPDEDGSWAYVTPVHAEADGPETASSEATVWFGEVVDLIAWCAEKPERWALRRGSATWLCTIGPQLLDPDPVPIWRTPLAWLQAGGEGLCLLSQVLHDRQRVLFGIRHILAEDVEHGRELRDTVLRPIGSRPSLSGPLMIGARHELREANTARSG